MFALSWLLALSSLLLLNWGVLAAPKCALRAAPSAAGSVGKRDGPSTRFVIYSDKWVSGITGPPPVSEIQVSAPTQPPAGAVVLICWSAHRASTFCTRAFTALPAYTLTCLVLSQRVIVPADVGTSRQGARMDSTQRL